MVDAACCKTMLSMVTVATLSIVLFTFPPINARAVSSTTYEVVGTVGLYDTNHYWIFDVQANDTVLISVSPDANRPYGYAVFFPNLTEIEPVGSYGTSIDPHEFIAEETGNYLLRIYTWGSSFNYTVKSSRSIDQPIQKDRSIITNIDSTYLSEYHIGYRS